MNLRLMIIIILLLIAPIVCTNTAYADVVTINYQEAGHNNRERMRWRFHCSTLELCSGIPMFGNPQVAWTSGVTSMPLFLRFTSTHIKGPHTIEETSNFDIDPGQLFAIHITFIVINALPVADAFTRLGMGNVPHTANLGDHSDHYEVLGRKTPGGEFDFELTSTHVPEPTTMLLLGTGLAGVAIKTRKRLKSRKSKQGG